MAAIPSSVPSWKSDKEEIVKFAIIGMLASPLILIAQNGGAWTNIGPSPAAVEAFAVGPQGSGTIFMGTIAGVVQKSSNDGASWLPMFVGLGSYTVKTLAMDASGPQTVYAGTIGDGMFRTGDGGFTWQNVPALAGSIASIATDPKRPGIVYAGVFSNLAKGALEKSTDGGATWTTLFSSTATIFNITIDPGNPDTVYFPTVGHGAFKSTDGGQHWSAITSLTPQAVWTMALDPANSQILYAGTNDDGVWKSADAGNTWQQTGSLGSFPVYSLAVDAAHSVYAGTNGGGVWSSSDGGVTWKPTGLSNGMILALALDSAGALYGGTSSAGAQISHDHGVTWTTLNTGVDLYSKFGYGIWIDPKNSQKIFVGDEDMYGLVWSQDGGATWSAAPPSFTARGTRSVVFDPTNSKRIYASGLNGDAFFKSTDGGLTWSARRFGSSAVYVIAVAVDPLSPNTVYAGTQNEGFFRSEDYGDTWESVGAGLSGSITRLTADPTDVGRLFASTATATYLSEDAGSTWTNVLNLPAWTVTIDPGDPSTVYATTRTQGVFRSSDGGHTWQSIGLTNLAAGPSAPVIVDPANRQTLYVGGDGSVFKSLDGGDHWFAVNSGLLGPSVSGLAMDPANSSVLYACGAFGVFKTVTGGEGPGASIFISSIANAASYSSQISSGETVVITGSGLASTDELTFADSKGTSGPELSGTEVRFNAIPATLIYTSSTQVAAIVPDLGSDPQAQVTVSYEGRISAPVKVGIATAAPGLFTLDSSGSGQAVALNQDGSINGGLNPAKVGEAISLFATGTGPSGGTVTVTIGATANIPASTKSVSPGVVEIDVKIPGGVTTGGAVPVVVVAGGNGVNSSSQPGVTIALQLTGVAYAAAGTSIGGATAATTDTAGNIYFISSNSVFRVDPNGALTRIAGNLKPGYSGDGGPAIDAQLSTDDLVNGAPQFYVPGGLAIDSKGNLYISDGGNARVRRISPDGVITTVAGNGTPGDSGDGGPAISAQIMNPRGLAVDAEGNLYIADTAAVRKISTGGIISKSAPFGGLGVAVDSGGNLFIVDYTQVRMVSPAGAVKTVAGGTGIIGISGDGGPATSAAFIGPTAVAIDSAGNLYIGDVSRVRKVTPDGIVNTVAGGGSADPGDGGPATSAQILVVSIALDNSANLYIAGYGRVRKVSHDGTITTVAGNGN
jgi:uncharacterized protein (TIGR03437 family)